MLLKRIDLTTLLAALSLVIIGLLSLYSATHNAAVFVKFQKQIFWAVIGVLLISLIMLAGPRFFHYSSTIFYFIGVGLLILVIPFGKSVSGNAGWFGIGSFGIQPAEFAKFATILGLAKFLSDSTTSLTSFRDLLKAILIVAAPWALIIAQPDFGTGLVFWGFFLVMLFWSGAEMILLLTLISPVVIAVLSVFNLWWFLAATILIVALFYLMKRNIGVALLFLTLNLSVGFGVQYVFEWLPVYQKERIAVYLDPTHSIKSAGYNVMQFKVAVGSGGLTGKGYLQGTQTQLRFVPEQWTDFIYCVPAEEFGFLGASAVLILFGVLIYRGIRIARAVENRFTSLVVIGIIAVLVIHVFVNIGMTLGLLPVIGIPLPLMSYGGSFYLTSMAFIGVMLHTHANISRTEIQGV